jgi:uncharacterized protein
VLQNRIEPELMRRDELRMPLKRRSFAERLWSKRPSLLVSAYALTTLLFAAGAYFAVTTPLPFAGEPVIVAQLPAVEEITTASTDPAPATASNETVAEQQPDEEPVTDTPKYTIERPLESEVEHQEAAVVISPRRGLTKAPIVGVSETTKDGQLPRISDSGSKPSVVYARPVSMNVTHSDSPRIAIILGGMGLSEDLTQRAAKELPPDVSLAFAPYGNNLQNQVDVARKNGHEILLQVPMEPVGFPATNPGPKTLLADSDKAANLEALHWHMSRFAGYTSIINYMGGRFLANPAALKPMLAEIKQRGLLFIEDGTMPLTAATSVAKMTGTQTRRANLVIDSDSNPQSIAAALSLLENEAETNGIAIGTGSGLPATIDAVKEWAKQAAERGIILIPASAAFKGRSG